MKDVFIGKGNLDGKGVYASRDFKKGEIVIKYSLRSLTENEYQNLPVKERMFVHRHRGQKYLYGEPEKYVNHSDEPNTCQDHRSGADIALRDIRKGEAITCDSSKDDVIQKSA